MNEKLTQPRLCFVPKSHSYDEFIFDDDKFLTLAFQGGQVLSLDEFERAWYKCDSTPFANHWMKVLEVYPTCWEMCPHCESEVELITDWSVQKCPVCGKPIIPCNLCGGSCMADCPLERLIKEYERVAERK